MLALQNIPRHKRSAVAREWARRSNAVQAEARKAREPDFRTARLRALNDRRGELIREGVSYRAGRVHDWRIVRSVRGRINQVDLIIDGQRWRTGSLERAEIASTTGVWRSWSKGVNTKAEKPAQIRAA